MKGDGGPSVRVWSYAFSVLAVFLGVGTLQYASDVRAWQRWRIARHRPRDSRREDRCVSWRQEGYQGGQDKQGRAFQGRRRCSGWKIKDYDAARWHPLHFKPAIDTATNEQCLACHKEVLTTPLRTTSPAGAKAADAKAWYQSLDTYAGAQQSFHARHLTSPLAKQYNKPDCDFCHQGNDPREEAPGSSTTTTVAAVGEPGPCASRSIPPRHV